MTFDDMLERESSMIVSGVFATPVSITQDGVTVTKRCIYDATYIAVDPDTQAQVMSELPRITIADNDFTFKVRRGARVEVKGKEYKVREPQPDGQGWTVLYLGNYAQKS